MATESVKQIVVQGTGYVGLPAALLLADAGYQVVGVDVDENVVRALNSGVLHIDEAELHEVMARSRVRENLVGASEPVPADVFLVAVPTPIDQGSKEADLRILGEALEALVPVLREDNLVIIESTIPPGTSREFATRILESGGLNVGDTVHLAHCPERILPGNVFREITHNDRIIGSDSVKGLATAREIYSQFVVGELLETDIATAELAKLIENASRDVSIAFANEVAEIALGFGIEPAEVIALANRHPRVDILTPGIGVGGHCIPIDPWFIVEVDTENSTMIQASRSVNDKRPQQMARRVLDVFRDLEEPKLVLAGLTYKADCEDLRESPAMEIARILDETGLSVELYDPLVSEFSRRALLDVANEADGIVVLVPHSKLLDELSELPSRAEMRILHLP